MLRCAYPAAVILVLCALAAVLLTSLLVPASAPLPSTKGTLANELRALEPMKKGKATPLDQVDRVANRLLGKYTGGDDRSQIYCAVALVYCQSGARYSQFIEKYSKRALDLPAEPLKRLRRFDELGGLQYTIQYKHHPFGTPSSTFRPMAAVYLLEGLRDAKKYNIPEERPLIPRDGPVMALIVGNERLRAEVEKLIKENAAAQTRAVAAGDLWDQRHSLAFSIVGEYSNPPYAATELRKLATAILEDPAAVDALMKQLEKNGALKDDPPDKK